PARQREGSPRRAARVAAGLDHGRRLGRPRAGARRDRRLDVPRRRRSDPARRVPRLRRAHLQLPAPDPAQPHRDATPPPRRPRLSVGWHELELESEALRGNPLGDPHVRPLFVWTPPAYDADPERRFPSVYLLQGLVGRVRAWFNTAPFAKT